jgi:hypothetical protein
MRVIQTSARRTAVSLGVRSGASLLAGTALGLFASWWLVMAVLFVVFNEGPEDLRNGVFLFLVVGVAPAAWAVFALVRGFQGIRQHLRLRDLVRLARRQGGFDRDDVTREMDIEPLQAELLILDAAAAGLVEEGGDPAQLPAGPVTTLAGAGRAERASEPRDLTGVVLNNSWVVEHHLRSGGMGAVYRGHHVRTGKPCAIKIVLAEGGMSEQAIRRFSREAQAASALGHPGIVAVRDFDVAEDGTHYLVMELLLGETLEDRLARDGSLPWPEALQIGREVGVALAAAHEAGILHRDLKPGNVFLTDDPTRSQRAVLLDFGLARPLEEGAVSRITTTGMVLGTPAYMSPEQARGEELDVRSDVHALGAILHEMVTGEPPFMDQSLAAVYAKLLMAEAPAASEVARVELPPELDALLKRALAKSRDDRFVSVGEMMEQMEGVEAESVDSVSPVS